MNQDFECPRCGHCCKTDLARVGEVGVWGESQAEGEEHMSREVMQMALEALESDPISHAGIVSRKQAITALRQALKTEQKTAVSPDGGTGFIDGVWHEPEPTAWRCQCGKAYTVTCISSKPAKREWVGLTDDAVFELADTNLYEGGKNYGVLAFAKAIEQALKEKNQ